MMLAVGRSGILLPSQVRPTSLQQIAVSNGLVVYLGFDADCLNFSTGVALDLSGNSNNGTFFNLTAASFAQGKVGGALTFSNGSVEFGASPPLGGASVFSIFGWVNSSLNTGYRTVYANSALGFWIKAGQIDWFSGVDHLGATVMSNSLWYHVGFTSNGTTLRGYVNGAQDMSVTFAATLPTGSATGIGAHGNNTEPFSGMIDDVRIYNRALDPWEVIELYQAGLAGRRDASILLPAQFEMPVPALPSTGLPHHRYFFSDVGSLMNC